MRKLIMGMVMSCSALFAAVEPGLYVAGSWGGAGHDVGKQIPAFSYMIPARMDRDDAADAHYKDYRVNVTARDMMGQRVAATAGVVLGGVYRVEGEFSLSMDRVRLCHRCPELQMSEEHTLHRRSFSCMANLGGFYPGWMRMKPFSMVGLGVQSEKNLGVVEPLRFCYQWITGAEAAVNTWSSFYFQHRYRKAFRSTSMHSAELGLKVYL